MSLVKLLEEVGDDNIEFQWLRPSIVKSKKTKADVELTFVTDQITPNDVVNNTGKVALVVWVDQDTLELANKSRIDKKNKLEQSK